MLGIQTLDIWCRLDFALEMLYVACWREAIKCFTMFSWHLSALAKAMNRDLIPGGLMASRMFLLFIGLLHFQPGIAVHVKVGFIPLLSKPTKLVETSSI